MSQHDMNIANQSGSAFRQDLNNALAALVGLSSGASEPSSMFAFQLWADTTNNLLKLRNSSNSGWITLRQLDGDFSVVSVDNGTAAAPSIYFNASGTDTGIYSSGTDAVDVATAGTRRLGIASGGDVTVYGGNVTLNAQGDLRLADSDSSNWVAFQAPATVASNVTWTLPSADGTSGQALSTNGSGTLSWTTIGGASITQGNTSAEVVDTGSDGHFKVTTEGTEAMRITAAQQVGIGTTSPGALVDIAGSNGRMYIRDGAANEAKFVALNAAGTGAAAMVFETYSRENGRFDSSGRLLVGTSTARSNFFNSASGQETTVQIEGTTGGTSSFSLTRNTNGEDPPHLIFGKTRGTSVGSNTVVQSGDRIGLLDFQGADGSEMVRAASIETYVDGTPGANDMPGRLAFSTTADGASSPTERLRIANNGQLSAVVPSGSTLYPGFMARAWVNFNGTGTVAIRASGNVSSITDNGTGIYRVNFATAMPDADYSITASTKHNTGVQLCAVATTETYTTTYADVYSSFAQSGTSGANFDSSIVNVAIFR